MIAKALCWPPASMIVNTPERFCLALNALPGVRESEKPSGSGDRLWPPLAKIMSLSSGTNQASRTAVADRPSPVMASTPLSEMRALKGAEIGRCVCASTNNVACGDGVNGPV